MKYGECNGMFCVFKFGDSGEDGFWVDGLGWVGLDGVDWGNMMVFFIVD